MVNLRVHKLRAQALRSQETNALIISYDCQKNVPLPKLPNQATYYSRQLYHYNFTVCIGSSHDGCSDQNKNNTMVGMVSYWLKKTILPEY